MVKIEVGLKERGYPIVIGREILGRFADLTPTLDRYSSAAILTHPALEWLFAEPVRRSLASRKVRTATLMVPSGERHKNLRSAARLYDQLLEGGFDRKGLIIIVGGGVLGDLGGFVAATFLRGVDFIQVPTTLLAQVDASIGGKTGVDLPDGKNLVGAFHQPRAVIVDTEAIRTLPARELRSGLAEVIKYGVIADKQLFARLAADMPLLLRRNHDALSFAIERCCRIKADVVARDETEEGRRAILNFGHTVGHALESVTGYRRFTHGEAISIGMVSASLIGEEFGITPRAVTTQLSAVLASARLPVPFPSDVPHEGIINAIGRDKKAVGGRARFVLARSIGNVEHGIDVPETAVRAALARQTQARPAD